MLGVSRWSLASPSADSLKERAAAAVASSPAQASSNAPSANRPLARALLGSASIGAIIVVASLLAAVQLSLPPSWPRIVPGISYLLDKPADPTILSHRTVEPNLTARKLTSLATHAIPIPDKRGLTHRSRRPRGDIAT